MKKLNKKGFTLIELIVVIAILAILAAILIPSLTNYIQKATDSKNQANCRSLYTAYQLELATQTGTTFTAPANNTGGTIATTPTTLTPGTALTEFSCTIGGKTFSLSTSFAIPN